MIFTDGGAFTWRNGDTSDAATGVKCMIEQVGHACPAPCSCILTLGHREVSPRVIRRMPTCRPAAGTMSGDHRASAGFR
jgi:hypothetical protein